MTLNRSEGDPADFSNLHDGKVNSEKATFGHKSVVSENGRASVTDNIPVPKIVLIDSESD